jgi:hypothetical protein
MSTGWHFPVFVAVSFAAFVAILRVALNRREERPASAKVLTVATIVVVGGMVFARAGTALGWPVWVYYGLPALLTWVLPPVALQMRGREIVVYVAMAMLMAPAIHVTFAFLLGWNEYMPFIPVPSLAELVRSAS